MNLFAARPLQRLEYRGFTLVELLVVIAILGIVISLLLPAVQVARESARRSQCTKNMKQVALSLHVYHDASSALPPSATQNTVDGRGRYGWSWMLFILPFIEQTPLHDACMGQVTWRMQVPMFMDTTVAALARAPVPQFICPTDSVGVLAPEAKINSTATWLTFTASKSNYLGNGGVLASWHGNVDQQMRASQGAIRKVRGTSFKDIVDGLSKTFLIGEAGGVPAMESDADRMPGIWSGTTNQNNTQPEIVRYTAEKLNSGSPWAFGSFHATGANFAFVDGSVRFIDDTIHANPPPWGFDASIDASIANYLKQMSDPSRGVWERLSTRADGLAIEGF